MPFWKFRSLSSLLSSFLGEKAWWLFYSCHHHVRNYAEGVPDHLTWGRQGDNGHSWKDFLDMLVFGHPFGFSWIGTTEHLWQASCCEHWGHTGECDGYQSYLLPLQIQILKDRRCSRNQEGATGWGGGGAMLLVTDQNCIWWKLSLKDPSDLAFFISTWAPECSKAEI